MFTGLVQAIGTVVASETRGGDRRLTIRAEGLGEATLSEGESIAVSGVCLTAIDISAATFSADVSLETLSATTLGGLQPGAAVNLERSLVLGQALGGHLVTGHVDGLAEVASSKDDGRSRRLVFSLPSRLSRYVATKGSICVDGVSLTVNEVLGDQFGVNIVPHTLAATTLGTCSPGGRVNVEVDIIARYLERLLAGQQQAAHGLDNELLGQLGFGKGRE